MNILLRDKFGTFTSENTTFFRFFAPEAASVHLHIFNSPEEKTDRSFSMVQSKDDIWEYEISENLAGKYYGYKVVKRETKLKLENLPIIVDPYARAVTTYTTHLNPRKTLITTDESFDWEEDRGVIIRAEDLIIYETHLRDLTAHPSAGAASPGTYAGFAEKGIPYLKQLGINAVEFLPLMEFGYLELPFNKRLVGKFNSWNPYERNHWGYMTSNYFAPSAYYSMPVKELPRNKWIGETSDHLAELKKLIKELHKNNIAVILDVVFNHLSEYEEGNLKQINIPYFFRTDKNGQFISESFCGNDLKTENPFVQNLICDSLVYWMQEFHVDGFRFDLCNIIDNRTLEKITSVTKKINPDVILIAEPWGGGYEPRKFSSLGWASWNDLIRNGIKGQNPFDAKGWIFGEWYGNDNLENVKNYLSGTIEQNNHGLFLNKSHSVNYLESHDGFTLGDFIRLATGDIDYHDKVEDLNNHAKLNRQQMRINKLAALFLFVAQGVVMIHSGQEFARSKVIEFVDEVEDVYQGRIDHNSYEKDNNTNYINFEHKEINIELFEYYRGLISFRKTFEAFRKASHKDIKFHELIYTDFAIAFELKYRDEIFFIILNADRSLAAYYDLPSGDWDLLVDAEFAGTDPIKQVRGSIKVPPVSGIVLKKVS